MSSVDLPFCGLKSVFAHRGGAKLAPENTMAAFAHGLALGSDGIECDVHLSRDGIPVVIHDKTVDRTTNGTGLVRDLTAAELAALDAGYHFGSDETGFPFRGRGIGVPTLDAVLQAFPQPRVIIEMKAGDGVLAEAVAASVCRANAAARVCVGSFDRRGLDLIRRAHPSIATSASPEEARWTLYRSWVHWPFEPRPAYRAFQVPEHAGRLRVVSPAFLRRARRQQARVDVWVVDDEADIRRLFAWGVDGVISDRPDVAVAVRDAWNGAGA